MEEIGNILKEARIQKGVDFEEITSAIKIQEKYIKALESDDLGAFSADIYYKSFLKSYASFLGLNAEELSNRHEEMKKAAQAVANVKPVAVSEAPDTYRDDKAFFIKGKFVDKISNNQNSKKFLIMGGILIAAIIVLIIVFILNLNRNSKLNENEVNESTSVESYSSEEVLKTEPVAVVAAIDIKKQQTGNQNAVALPLPSLPNAVAKITPVQTQTSIPTPAPTQTRVQTAQAVDSGTGSQVLEIRTIEEAWVKVESDGKLVFEGILPKDSTRVLRSNSGFRIRVGYARALKVKFNGQEIDATKGARDDVNTINLPQ
jgi:cytoskeletal protein RodZ